MPSQTETPAKTRATKKRKNFRRTIWGILLDVSIRVFFGWLAVAWRITLPGKNNGLKNSLVGGLEVLSWCLHQSPGSGESTCSSARRVNPGQERVNQALENLKQSFGQSAR